MTLQCSAYNTTFNVCTVFLSDEVNACATNPCHHGECVNEGDGYVCNCEDGFEGVNCQSKIGLTYILSLMMLIKFSLW